MRTDFDENAEWLEADGLGGFASGTVSGIRTRRYHGLLLPATTPPTGRYVLVNGFDAWVETAAGSVPITSQLYTPEVVHPGGAKRIESFQPDPWPHWRFRLDDGTRIEQEIFVPHGQPTVVLAWRLVGASSSSPKLRVRPFLSGRDYHSLHHENPAFRFDARVDGQRVSWQPYEPLPKITAISNGTYEHKPDWYRNFLYREERGRGLDHIEDLAAPGLFHFDLSRGDAVLIFSADAQCGVGQDAENTAGRLRAGEKNRRRRFSSRLHRSADAYLVKRGAGKTIVAGYPWFTDWGRDTFIAMRGLCIATGRLDEARDILLEWAGTVSVGMLPNRFPDQGGEPEFNSVDASLWYIIAVHDFLRATERRQSRLTDRDRRKLQEAVEAILTGYSVGTRYGIHLNNYGLLASGEPGVQLTWMDAKVGNWVVTPRIGKPVEIQALWLNALKIASAFNSKWDELFRRGLDNFRGRFWYATGGHLFDVVDVDHQIGNNDAVFRPNQIFAVGGLPFQLIEGERARQIVDAVEARLLTPMGLRSLAKGEPGYCSSCDGSVLMRDSAYHQGTVWPWLIGPFVEAWVRVRGGADEVKNEGRRRFIEPLLDHLDHAGIGHISEIADADPPHTPRGCPFQAWSVGEVLRLTLNVLSPDEASGEGTGSR